MKNLIFMSFVIFLSSLTFADVLDDGVLSTGEYYSGIIDWYSSAPPLIVDGGGAVEIEIRAYGKLEVYSSSIPDQSWHIGGIRDIDLKDNSSLLYLDGITHSLLVRENAVAALKGGYVKYLQSYFDFMSTGHVDLYCQSNWSWLFDEDFHKVGITGYWGDDTAFNIGFIDRDNYAPVWMGVNVIEVPEPVSLLLLSLGGLLLKRKK